MKTLIIMALILIALLTLLAKGQTTSNLTYAPGALIDIGTGADVCADAIIINGTYSGGGTICQGPLPVTMLSFTASVVKNDVKLEWTTAAELNNSGFDVERRLSKDGDQWKKISFVPGSGTTNETKSYMFLDKKLQTAGYKYRLKQIDLNGNHEYFALESDVVVAPPIEFSMSQNYPNPSNPKSKIDYQLPVDGRITIRLYDIIGKEVLMIVNENKIAGYYSAEFDGTNLASGAYFYRISIEGSNQHFTKTLKMILVK
jgi:hypothetical protein